MSAFSPRQDTTPLDRLMAEHAAGVFRYLCSLVSNVDSARDLQQDTFLKLNDQAANAGKALVYTVARNCALDHLRRLRSRNRHEIEADPEMVPDPPASPAFSPDRRLQDQQLHQDLLQGLATMPEEQRTVFHLSEIEGVPYKDIATIIGVSPGTIASRKHHAVNKLREYLRSRGHAF